MQWREVDRGELIATAGGIVLGISVFLDWYSVSSTYANLNGCRGPNGMCTAWKSLVILRFLLLIAAVAPAILTWIILRGHALSWPRGELTALIALAALTFTVFRGVIDKPGSPQGEISITYGWWVALVGGALILVGSLYRSKESAQQKKPPGVL
jgi:CDP-diglyceride synthetase